MTILKCPNCKKIFLFRKTIPDDTDKVICPKCGWITDTFEFLKAFDVYVNKKPDGMRIKKIKQQFSL